MKDTLNLNDNPFDPELPHLGRQGGEPLLPELYADLKERYPDLQDRICELFCMEVAGMADAKRKLLRALFRDKKPDQAPVQRNAILLIVGPAGSGRTTLANLVAAHIRQTDRLAGPTGVWKRFELKFPRTVLPADVTANFNSTRTEVSRAFSDRRGKALLMIENLPKSSFDHVLDACEAFSDHKRVFIVTSTDRKLLDRDLDASSVHIERVELTRLTEEEVYVFIKDRLRLPKYWAGDIPALQNRPELALFPFAESAPRVKAGNPLQQVRTWAYKRIDDKHFELCEKPDLRSAALADLAELQTRLIQS